MMVKDLLWVAAILVIGAATFWVMMTHESYQMNLSCSELNRQIERMDPQMVPRDLLIERALKCE